MRKQRKTIAQTQWSAKKKARSLTKKTYTKRKAYTDGGKGAEAESQDRAYEDLTGPRLLHLAPYVTLKQSPEKGYVCLRLR
jgi:hypothetical protein